MSWDALPTPARFYNIPNGEEVLPITFAVPVLRRLVRARLKALDLDEAQRSRLLASTAGDAADGYTALSRYQPSISKDWLVRHGISEDDARTFAIAGTSRHPIVGLLRSSQDSSIASEDYEKVLQLLKPSDARSYQALQKIAHAPRRSRCWGAA